MVELVIRFYKNGDSAMERVIYADECWIADPEVFKVNREEAHSDHAFYEEKVTEYGLDMPLRQSFNGTWKFSYADVPDKRVKDFYEENFDISGFSDIKVPGHIELAGYDTCQYINVMYPWEGHENLRPPFVPAKHNPVGSYVTYFDVDEALLGKKTYISFQGVEKAFYVWINGTFVGYSEDSFTPSEWDITPFIREKGNKLAVEVYKHSSASWLEDQDFFRFSGIFRDVFIYAVPDTHVRDIFVKAGLKEDYSTGTLDCELKIEGNIAGTVGYELVDKTGKSVLMRMGLAIKENMHFKAEVPEVLTWSAEVPNLYLLNISVYNEDGELVEYIPQRIGFRTFEMKNGVMCINGKRIVFKGVNRHEFSCVNGRALKKEELLEDIRIIKSLNINAVRTSHYPNRSCWYELCDEFGVYLIDETNLETHGTWAVNTGNEAPYITPGSEPMWKENVLDRAKSMLERDKNHPSVLIWSCGNEAHAGEDILAMSRFFHERNPERLVHYEGCVHDRRYSDITDMESRMYAKPDEIREYLESRPQKPYISCEYMHAMGNSCGGMEKYTKLEYDYEQYQGGFIWDFADQAILTRDGKLIDEDVIGRYGNVRTYEKLPNITPGSLEFKVGGDFKERPCDYYFSGDGIVFADRKLSPKAQEVKYLYQNIKLHLTKQGVLIVNENLFESTDDYMFEVRLLKDGKAVWAGTFARDVAAGEEEFVPVSFPSMEDDGEYVMECRAVLMGYRPWANVGHVAAWGQSEPAVVKKSKSAKEEQEGRQSVAEGSDKAQQDNEVKYFDDVVMGATCIGVTAGHTHAIFSRQEGGLISFRVKGLETIEKVPTLEFFRAATDNDKGNAFPVTSAVWQGVSQMQRCDGVKVVYELRDGRELDGTVTPDEFILDRTDALYGTGFKGAEFAKSIAAVKIICHYTFYTNPVSDGEVAYRMLPDGSVECTGRFNGREGLPQMAVFGVNITMDKMFDRMEFYGRGPEENYNDRCAGAKLGIYKGRVADNVTPYLDPQECGNRHDVRYVKVVDEFGHGLRIDALEKPFDMTVLPCSQQELQSAYKINDLPDTRYTFVRILGAARGVGGDDSWGAPVYPEYCVSAEKEQRAAFTIRGL